LLLIQSFYHQESAAFCHLIVDDLSGVAALIDPVLGFDVVTGRVDHEFMDAILAKIKLNNWHLKWSLETHVHADHLTASNYVKERLGAKLVISDNVKIVQLHFDEVYATQSVHERSFDLYVKNGDCLDFGEFKIRVLETPGHTPACVSYVIEDGNQAHAFVGDTIFMPNIGTARCDFPGGDAAQLFDSIQTLYALGSDAFLYMCHDTATSQRPHCARISVGEQQKNNIHCAEGMTKDEYIKIRQNRDASLSWPKLMLCSIQVNIRAGLFPAADTQGRRYLKIPVS